VTATAAAYVRISDDKLGDAAGVARQTADCQALAERLGWTITDVYCENDRSAFKRRKIRVLGEDDPVMRVYRPEFRRMLGDLRAGTVNALVAYDLDRVARDPRDMEDLIDLVRKHSIPTATVTGNLDLSNDAGVLVARINVAVAAKSSEDTARRVSRKHLELAERGRVSGGGLRAYGYETDGMTIRPSEATVIRELAARIIAGETLSALARDLQARGFPTVRGGPWTNRSVHSVISKARIAGLREYKGEIVGNAAWPAIITPEEWGQVKAALARRAQMPSANQLIAWLTGILHCGACGNLLTYGQQHGRRRYLCDPRKGGCNGNSVVAQPAEDAVAGWVLGFLARPDLLAALAEVTQGSTDAVRAEAAADEEQLAELTTGWRARRITTAQYLDAIGPIEERLKRARTLIHASAPASVRKFLDAEDLPAVWEDLAPLYRRDVARLVFPYGIRVEPSRERPRADRGRFLFDSRRLQPIDGV
jgi:site-specific DNA recombinase